MYVGWALPLVSSIYIVVRAGTWWKQLHHNNPSPHVLTFPSKSLRYREASCATEVSSLQLYHTPYNRIIHQTDRKLDQIHLHHQNGQSRLVLSATGTQPVPGPQDETNSIYLKRKMVSAKIGTSYLKDMESYKAWNLQLSNYCRCDVVQPRLIVVYSCCPSR